MKVINQKVEKFTKLNRGAGMVMPEMSKKQFVAAAKERLKRAESGDTTAQMHVNGMNINRFLKDLLGEQR